MFEKFWVFIVVYIIIDDDIGVLKVILFFILYFRFDYFFIKDVLIKIWNI